MGINELLNRKMAAAREFGIECEYEIIIPGRLSIETKDLGNVIGNLLDNAIDSLNKQNGRKYIKLVMLYYGNSLSITVENPIVDKITNLTTTKNDKDKHGFGVKSIKKSVEKYHGAYEWQAKANVFKVYVLMWDRLDITHTIKI